MNNWEKYYGTPEKAAEMRVEPTYDSLEMLDGVAVWKGEELLGIFWNEWGKSYIEWLQEEAE